MEIKMKTVYILYLSLCVKFYFGNCELDLLSEVNRQTVNCIKQIIARYYLEENDPVVISVARKRDVETTERKLVNATLPNDDVLVSDIIVRELTNGSSRPTIVWYSMNEDLLEMFLRIRSEKQFNFIYILRDYGKELEEIKELLEVSDFYFYGMSRGYFPKIVIELPEIPEEDRDSVNEFLMDLVCVFLMYNTVFIFPETKYVYSENTSEVTPRVVNELYTWFPFQEYQQCGECRDLVLIDRWNLEGNGEFEQNTDLFPSKMPKKYNGCSIKYSLLGISNTYWELEWTLLRSLFDSVNTTELVETQGIDMDVIFFRSLNGEFFSEENEAGRRSKYYPHLFSISYPHLFSKLLWYVPCPRKTVRHGHFYKVFAPGVWLLFFTSCILVAAITIALPKTRKCEYLDSLTYSLYCTWAVVTSVSVPRMPTTTKRRLFFFLWVCYCLIINTVFQTYFTSFLIEPGSEEQIDTLDNILKHNLTVFIGDHIGFMLYGVSHRSNISLESFDTFSRSDVPIEDFFTHERSAVLIGDLDMKTKFPSHLAGIEPCYFCFLECYSTHCVYFVPASPYYEAFNSKVLQYNEAGLLIKETDEYISSHSQSVLNVSVVENKFGKLTTEEYFIFNMTHRHVIFILYLCGNILSVFVFIAEVVLGKM
ncbi:hypothetical protein L9F63_024396 [Diploptera punctata]|uniref:Uncharacterized protein n=1 Tax=Diploptera punctata TaxID=6984 RepID=A0AAD8E7S0_DIPPU|nr:hypothetical protein L9F63_024396 [Diploptera punctata]